jgi:hypothetical protein
MEYQNSPPPKRGTMKDHLSNLIRDSTKNKKVEETK